jgi:hypothetical protein
VDVARPDLTGRESNEHRHGESLFASMNYRQGAVRPEWPLDNA